MKSIVFYPLANNCLNTLTPCVNGGVLVEKLNQLLNLRLIHLMIFIVVVYWSMVLINVLVHLVLLDNSVRHR